MRRSRVPIAEKRVLDSKTDHNSSQRKATPSDQKVMRQNFSVSMVNTRSAKEIKTKVSAVEGRAVPAIEIDLETPDQSVDEVERKTTKSTPMPNSGIHREDRNDGRNETTRQRGGRKQNVWNSFPDIKRGHSKR